MVLLFCHDDYGDFTVDLNNCKKFRYCRDEFENGICNTDEWNKEGGVLITKFFYNFMVQDNVFYKDIVITMSLKNSKLMLKLHECQYFIKL